MLEQIVIITTIKMVWQLVYCKNCTLKLSTSMHKRGDWIIIIHYWTTPVSLTYLNSESFSGGFKKKQQHPNLMNFQDFCPEIKKKLYKFISRLFFIFFLISFLARIKGPSRPEIICCIRYFWSKIWTLD